MRTYRGCELLENGQLKCGGEFLENIPEPNGDKWEVCPKSVLFDDGFVMAWSKQYSRWKRQNFMMCDFKAMTSAEIELIDVFESDLAYYTQEKTERDIANAKAKRGA